MGLLQAPIRLITGCGAIVQSKQQDPYSYQGRSLMTRWPFSTQVRLASLEEVLKAKAYMCFVSRLILVPLD